jgi:hypothetical protein
MRMELATGLSEPIRQRARKHRKETLRTIVQALQQYSREAKQIFDTTEATSPTQVIVLAEDLTQHAPEVAEVYPINKRFAGFID